VQGIRYKGEMSYTAYLDVMLSLPMDSYFYYCVQGRHALNQFIIYYRFLMAVIKHHYPLCGNMIMIKPSH
jgi:hypothetical protein